MKHRFQKLVSLLVAGVLLGSSLTGCGNAKEQSQGENATNQSSQAASGQNDSKAEDSGTKDKITVAIYDRGSLDPSEGTMEDNRWTKWINENAPVEVEFIAIPRWGSSDKYSTLLASDSAPDLILEYESSILGNMIANGSLMPIDEIIEQYSTVYKELLEKYPGMRKMGTVDGELYYITRAVPPSPNHVMLIRTDWLEKLNLSVPSTVDELYEVAEAFAKKDPDGNGMDDTYGYSLSFVSGQQIDYIFGMTSSKGFIQENGEFIYPWERMKAATQFRKELFDNGIVNKDYAADTSGEQAIQDFVAGKLGIIALNNGAATGQSIIENFYDNNPDGDVKVMPLPSSEYGQLNTAINPPVQVVGAINASCKNPEAVMKYLDWINSSEDIYSTLRYGGEEYSEQDEKGNWIPKDTEVFSKEVYGADFYMPISNISYHFDLASQYDESTKVGAKMIEICEDAMKYYIESDNAYAKEEIAAYPRPSLSSELSLINSNTYNSGNITDNWTKAVLSGDSYTVEQAEADNRKLIEDGGGQQVLDFYLKWYAETSAAGNLLTIEDYKAFVE